tara:strand:+ start:699 stop:986 length:288 start_codon:yes stop_codon:yes gene_type:complete
MRLTSSKKQQVLCSCRVTRPGAKLIRRDGLWLAVWHVERDPLVDPSSNVPHAARWRAQVVSDVDASGGVWWLGGETHAKTRTAALNAAAMEALIS